MVEPLFIATERFDSSDGEKWLKYFEWAKIPALAEVCSLDMVLNPPSLKEILDGDWEHNVNADFRLRYFYHLDYLLERVRDINRRNILGLYRNSETHVAEPPDARDFRFVGYDLIEEQTHISALTNCGGFPEVFKNSELNSRGLLGQFERASEVKKTLAEKCPEEPHAQCELYAIWRLNE